MQITFKPIGIVCNNVKTRHEMPWRGVTSEIHISPKYRKALFRITKKEYLWILCYLHQANTKVLIAKPKKSKQKPKIARGVFSIHSPDRPNPIALTKVKLIARRGLILKVKGLDVIDGTPVIDIKGYK